MFEIDKLNYIICDNKVIKLKFVKNIKKSREISFEIRD